MSTYKPTAAMAANAARALKVRQSKPQSQRGMTAVGLARANQLIRRDPISLETVKRIKAYFDRHVVDKRGSTWATQGKGWQAWMGWGGDEGWAWAKGIVAQEIRNNPSLGKHRDLFEPEDTAVLVHWRDVPERIMETLSAANFSKDELEDIEDEDEVLFEQLMRRLVKAANTAFPKADRFVDGREVRGGEVDNVDSIESTLLNYRVLRGVREVPLSLFPDTPYVSADDIGRVRRLAAVIKHSEEILPLIVVVDAEGGVESPYVLEGRHRLGALHALRAKAFPALVVVDLDP